MDDSDDSYYRSSFYDEGVAEECFDDYVRRYPPHHHRLHLNLGPDGGDNDDDDASAPWNWRLLRRYGRRFLAASSGIEGPSRIDYSVLSVGVMTLGLIMVVEVLRHRLDVAAVGRPFFKAVLEGVYTERTYEVLVAYRFVALYVKFLYCLRPPTLTQQLLLRFSIL